MRLSRRYANLDMFFPEAVRVLAPLGALIVYDFSQGSSFRDSPVLDAWFSRFLARYPMPRGSARDLSPETLGAAQSGLRLSGRESFQLGMVMAPDAYLSYVLTEANVAHAVRQGAAFHEIRRWCADTLASVFQGSAQEVLFSGYFAVMRPEKA